LNALIGILAFSMYLHIIIKVLLSLLIIMYLLYIYIGACIISVVDLTVFSPELYLHILVLERITVSFILHGYTYGVLLTRIWALILTMSVVQIDERHLLRKSDDWLGLILQSNPPLWLYKYLYIMYTMYRIRTYYYYDDPTSTIII